MKVDSYIAFFQLRKDNKHKNSFSLSIKFVMTPLSKDLGPGKREIKIRLL